MATRIYQAQYNQTKLPKSDTYLQQSKSQIINLVVQEALLSYVHYLNLISVLQLHAAEWGNLILVFSW
jgi:hypothetical protein